MKWSFLPLSLLLFLLLVGTTACGPDAQHEIEIFLKDGVVCKAKIKLPDTRGEVDIDEVRIYDCKKAGQSISVREAIQASRQK